MTSKVNKQKVKGGAASNMVVRTRYGKKETKLYVAALSAASIGTSVTRIALTSSIAGGADIQQRVGRRIRVKRVAFRAQLLGGQTNSVADDPFNAVRVTLVRCLPGATFTSYTVNNAIDPRFSISAGLLEVLYDRTVVVSTPAKDSTGYIPGALEYEFSVPVEVMCEYGSAAAAAPINQELVMYMTSDSSAVVNPGFSASNTVLLEYIDDA